MEIQMWGWRWHREPGHCLRVWQQEFDPQTHMVKVENSCKLSFDLCMLWWAGETRTHRGTHVSIHMHTHKNADVSK